MASAQAASSKAAASNSACAELEISVLVSTSRRSSCWCPLITRVLLMVGAIAVLTKKFSTPACFSSCSSWRPSSSSPQNPATMVLTPSPARFIATLAAPPGVSVRCSMRTIGTGASGEIRMTCPQTYLSSMMSPTTSTRARDHPPWMRGMNCCRSSSQHNSSVLEPGRSW